MFTRAHVLLALSLALFVGVGPRAPVGLHAADLRLERLELLSHGSLDTAANEFEVASRLSFDLSIAGGDKFGGLLWMDFLNGNIEDALAENSSSLPPAGLGTDLDEVIDRLNSNLSPRFRTAAIEAKSMFGLPLDLSYFVGYLDSFASGDDFTPLFGAAPFSTALRGPMVYPEGVGGNPNLFYEGLHAVNGTGLRLGTSPKLSQKFISYLYLYQDADLGVGKWSGDLRALFNTKDVKIELFAGASNISTLGIYRAGVLFYAAPGDIGEFFLQAGVPLWDPALGFTVDNLYFLFEPRLNFGFGSLALTVFYHPNWYRQKPTNEQSCLDTGFNLRFGKLSQQGFQAGLEGLLKLRSLTPEPLAIDLSPYYSLIAGGVEWDFKVRTNVFPLSLPWYGMFEPFIGLKTSY